MEAPPPRSKEQRLTVLEAGTMGAGITSLALGQGVSGTLVDSAQAALPPLRPLPGEVEAGDNGRRSGRGFFTYERTEQLS